MIPRKIHFIWVGDQPKPDLVLKCMNSWRKFLPNFELIEWGNEEFHKIKNRYAEQAFANKKWAFVSDYIRLYALYHHGGFYFDGDLEITRSLDEFLHLSFFSCHENYHGTCSPITTAMMAAEPGNHIVRSLLAEYDTAVFHTDEGLDQTPNTVRVSQYFASEFNIRPPYDDTRTTQLDANSFIFPASHFCIPRAGLPNYAIHHFNGSWKDDFTRKRKLKLPRGISLVRFRKSRSDTAKTLPLAADERLLFRLRISKRKILALIQRRAAH